MLNRCTLASINLIVVLLLSGCTLFQQYEQRNYINELKKNADSGVISAQLELANVYESGSLLPQSDSAALDWYRRSAALGSAEGAYRAALLLKGNDANQEEYTTLLEQAARARYAPAQLSLANLLLQGSERDEDTVRQMFLLYRSAAEAGLPEAQLKLADMLVAGRGTDRDLESALGWYRKAAEQGDRRAQLAVGDFYLKGIRVPVSIQTAFDWYEKSALLGSVQAQSNVGDLLTLSRYSALQNFNEGAEWYKKAASAGHAHAGTRLGQLYEEGKGVPKDLQLAANWYLQAAEKGNASAQCRLGSLYFRGLGLPQDNLEAKRWFDLAAAQVPAGVTTLLGFIHYDCREFDPQIVEAELF